MLSRHLTVDDAFQCGIADANYVRASIIESHAVKHVALQPSLCLIAGYLELGLLGLSRLSFNSECRLAYTQGFCAILNPFAQQQQPDNIASTAPNSQLPHVDPQQFD